MAHALGEDESLQTQSSYALKILILTVPNPEPWVCEEHQDNPILLLKGMPEQSVTFSATIPRSSRFDTPVLQL